MIGISQLIAAYNGTGINDSNRAILGWILQNLGIVGKCSIYTLAEETFSSTATISRLIKKMGYPNYHYFQKEILDDFRQYEYHNRIIPYEKIQPGEDAGELLISTLKHFIEEIENTLDKSSLNLLIDELYKYEKIALYLYEEVTSKFFLQYDLFMQGKLCESYSYHSDICQHYKNVQPDTLIIMFSSNRIKHSETRNIIQSIKEKGVKICFVTNSKHYATKIDADIKFVLPGIGAGMDMLTSEIFMYLVTISFRQRYDEIWSIK